MIAIGIGCRRGCDGEEIAGLVRRALAALPALPAGEKDEATLAAPARKRGEAGIGRAAALLALPVRFVDDDGMAAAQDRTHTRSARVAAAVGVASVAEAAALAVAGPGARLVLTRINTARATCAIAFG